MIIMDKIATKYGLDYEEQQLMAVHNLTNDAHTRQGLIEVLEDMQTYISPDDPLEDMLRQNTKDALAHLRQMTDEDFAELDLTVDFPD